MHWEKTVEYFFLWHCTTQKLVDFASPLSGKQERGAGDAVFGKYSNLLLVEFKSDANNLDSEKDKFDNFESAKRILRKSDSHHLIVYGEMHEETFSIKAMTYFSRKFKEIDSSLPKGESKEGFDAYLAKFLDFRKKDGRSGAKAAVPDFANVIGLSDKGKIVQACTLADYALEVFPSRVKNLDNKRDAHPASNLKFRP